MYAKFHSQKIVPFPLEYTYTEQHRQATQGGETVTECWKISFQSDGPQKSVTWSYQTSSVEGDNSKLQTLDLLIKQIKKIYIKLQSIDSIVFAS